MTRLWLILGLLMACQDPAPAMCPTPPRVFNVEAVYDGGRAVMPLDQYLGLQESYQAWREYSACLLHNLQRVQADTTDVSDLTQEFEGIFD